MNKLFFSPESGVYYYGLKLLELKKQSSNLLPEAVVIDFGLDLAANESRNPAKQNPTQPADLQRSASQPTRKDCPAGPAWSARMDKQPVYKQRLQSGEV